MISARVYPHGASSCLWQGEEIKLELELCTAAAAGIRRNAPLSGLLFRGNEGHRKITLLLSRTKRSLLMHPDNGRMALA